MFAKAIALVVVLMLTAALLSGLVAGAVSRRGAVWPALLVPLVITVVLMGWGRRFWRPARRLVNATGRLADGDYSTRVEGFTGPLTPVAASFNRMAQRLERAEERRRGLLADLGHELRTPLAVIKGNIEALIDGVHASEPERFAGLLEEVEVMERLLDDLQTLSISEAGRLTLHREPTDPVVEIDEIITSLSAKAESLGVQLLSEAPEPVPVCNLDPVRIRQVLSNLISNALTNTPSGGSVRLSVAPAEQGGTRWSVSDTGRGIAADQLPHIFDRFVKGADSRGSGLGLTIARDLVEAHGGRIEITSRLGEGTTVSFVIPPEQ